MEVIKIITKKTKFKMLLEVLCLVCLLFMIVYFAKADPSSGTTISSNVTDNGRIYTPANRTDSGGTITTFSVDAQQQDTRWKAYVGNVTGSLTLDDSDGMTIYNWTVGLADITGEVYSSRASSVSWSLIRCASTTTVASEQTTLGMNSSSADTITKTFNETTHPEFVTAGETISSGCNATATYVNDAREDQSSATFPLVLLDDETNLIYTAIINRNSTGFDNSNYDFQMIVANDPTSTTTYYFYVELGN